jgi:hypothetical protein
VNQTDAELSVSRWIKHFGESVAEAMKDADPQLDHPMAMYMGCAVAAVRYVAFFVKNSIPMDPEDELLDPVSCKTEMLEALAEEWDNIMDGEDGVTKQ